MDEDRRYVLLGTAGHIDHGKTALVKMLTGCETDTLREEKERGLTIDLGFAPCELRRDLMACIVDVPGHEKFIRNMVAGASGIDAVLLVVAANDSVMPQTREHLRIVELLGIDRGLVAVTKIDMVDEELRELVVEEVRDFLRGTFLEHAPVCPVSSVTGEGFEDLWTALTEVVDACRDRPVSGIFQMPVERVFTLKGFGTVITGMPPSGRIRIGDTVELLPQGQKGRLRGMQVYGKDAEVGWAGQCLALNISDVDHRSVVRGNVIAAPGYLRPARMAEVRVSLLPGVERPLKHQAPVRFHVGTAEIMGRMFLLDRDRLEPGETAPAQFRAEEPIITAPGTRFVIRQYSPVVTIGGGRILRLGDRKVKRFREGVIRDLEALEGVLDDEKERVAWLLERAGRNLLREDDLRTRAFLPAGRLSEILSALAAEGRAVSPGPGGTWVSSRAVDEVGEEVREAVARYHAGHPLRLGVTMAGLRDAVDADPAVLAAAADRLVAAGELVREEGKYRAPDHEPVLTPADRALAEKTARALAEAGTAPPETGRLAEELGEPPDRLRAVLDHLADTGRAVRLADDLYADPEVCARTRDLLVNWLREKGRIGVVDFRDLLGASRRSVYAWLDYFDREGVTYRVENLRYLREH